MNDHAAHGHQSSSLNSMALMATRHCLTGCAIGEVLGMVIGTSMGWHDGATVALSVTLAFFFGYLLTLVPLLRRGMTVRTALPVTLAVDTLSITIMEITDNAVMLAIPGAMRAGVASGFFWLSLAIALAVAFVAAYPVNRWLIQKGRGHALLGHG
jgi:hypothetical protein